MANLCQSDERAPIGRHKSNFKFKYNLLGRFFVSATPTVNSASRNVFPACAQFSLFCLALFAFKSRLALLLLLSMLFSPCRRQLCSRNFLFLLLRAVVVHKLPTHRVSYGNELYNKFKISHGIPNVLVFSLNEGTCNRCCNARALQGNSGKYRLKCGICAEIQSYMQIGVILAGKQGEFKGSRNERVSLHKFASTLRLRNIVK